MPVIDQGNSASGFKTRRVSNKEGEVLTHFDVDAVQDFLSFPLPWIPHSSCRPCICTLGTAWQGAHARRKKSHTASILAHSQKQQIGAETGKIIFNDVTCWYWFLMERNCTGIYKLQSFTQISDKYWESDKSRKAGSSVLSAIRAGISLPKL